MSRLEIPCFQIWFTWRVYGTLWRRRRLYIGLDFLQVHSTIFRLRFGRIWVHIDVFQSDRKSKKKDALEKELKSCCVRLMVTADPVLTAAYQFKRKLYLNIVLSVATPPGGSHHKLKVKLWIRFKLRSKL